MITTTLLLIFISIIAIQMEFIFTFLLYMVKGTESTILVLFGRGYKYQRWLKVKLVLIFDSFEKQIIFMEKTNTFVLINSLKIKPNVLIIHSHGLLFRLKSIQLSG